MQKQYRVTVSSHNQMKVLPLTNMRDKSGWVVSIYR